MYTKPSFSTKEIWTNL